MSEPAARGMVVNPIPPGPPLVPYEHNPNSIKYHVRQFVLRHQETFRNRTVVDAPAGSGVTSRILREVGAEVHAFDLFPEYFKVEGLTCERANLKEGIPVPDGFADVLICQEGIEHLSDQYRALQEFNRVLKPNGSLFITTPNYSNLQSKLSYLFFESEHFLKSMPENEVDSILMTDQQGDRQLYLGHLFLIGIQRLRLLAKLSGFRIKRVIPTHAKTTSIIMLPFAYPFILLASWLAYRRGLRIVSDIPVAWRKQVYGEILRLNCSPRILIDKYLFVEFEKEARPEEVQGQLYRWHNSFDVMT